MKIGLISINMYSKKLNFACPLHTYAFQQFLKTNGIESTVIDYKPVYHNNFDLKHPYYYYKEKYEELSNSGKKDAATLEKLSEYAKKRDAYQNLFQEREIRYEKFRNFIDTRYIKTEERYDSDLLEIKDPGFDCYICVTDVIWKNEPGEGFDRGFFLASKAMENKRKIAYAASRGVHFSDSHESETEFLYNIEDIDYISVREESLKQYIEENTSKKATVVLDPVLLNDKSFYEGIAIKPKEERYILLYYVMEKATDTIRMAVNYAKENNIKIVELTDFPYPNRLDHYEGIEKIYRYDIGIEEWLGYIMHAERIFTNSFHGTCFSILFEKNFFAGKRHGDKVTNLLEQLGLSDRRVSTYAEIAEMGDREIDYTKVACRLNEKRGKSKQFILDAIHACDGAVKAPHSYEWWKRAQTYKMIYHSGDKNVCIDGLAKSSGKKIEKLPTGNYQYYPTDKKINNGYSRFDNCTFVYPEHNFAGWRIRIRIDKRWFWYLANGKIALKNEYVPERDGEIAYFGENDRIPYIPVNHIEVMVAEAKWDACATYDTYTMYYNSGKKTEKPYINADNIAGTLESLPSGSKEFCLEEKSVNNGKTAFLKNGFSISDDYKFAGWKIRIKKSNKWYWYLEDNSFILKENYNQKGTLPVKCFEENALIPYIPCINFEKAVAEAIWEKVRYNIIYNSGKKANNVSANYNTAGGTLNKLPSGTTEFCPTAQVENNGFEHLQKNAFAYKGYKFAGWRLRFKEKERWYWYLEDGTLVPKDVYSKHSDKPIKIFGNEEKIPAVPLKEIRLAVAEAVWTKSNSKSKQGIKRLAKKCLKAIRK